MVASSRRLVTVSVVLALVLAACGDGTPAEDAAPAAVAATSTAPTMSTAPSTSAPLVPTATSRPFVELIGRVGEAISFEVPRPPGWNEWERSVWVVPEGEESRAYNMGTGGLLSIGTALGDRLRIIGVVPRTLASNRAQGAATFRAMTPGRYRVEAGRAQVAWLQVDGTGDAALPVGRAPSVSADRALLGDDHLAGTPFGTAEGDAHQRLVARFGPPTSDSGWVNLCLPHREVRWGGLRVLYGRSESPVGDRVLVAYEYVTSDDGPQGLTSSDGIALGSTLDAVLATAGPWMITAQYLQDALDQWWRGDLGEMDPRSFAVRFDKDVTAAGARPVVTAIASAWTRTTLHPFYVC